MHRQGGHVVGLVFSSIVFAMATGAWAAKAGEPGRLLTFGAGARSLGMGTAYTAIAQDATAAYWNPAGLAAVRRHEVNFLHAALYGDAAYDYLGYAGLHTKHGVLGGHFARVGVSGAELRDVNNNLLGTFGYSETALGLGYGFVLPKFPTLGLGAGAHMLSRALNGSSDRLIGMDFGSQYAVTQNLGVGLVAQNVLRMSQGDTDDKLPQRIRLGFGYQPFSGLMLSGDLDNFSQIALGLEYSWKLVAARAGVLDGSPTFGFGLRWRSLTFDVAMASSQDLGSSQRVSIGYAFGKPRGRESNLNPELSLVQLSQQADEAIELGYYAEGERLLRAAHRVKPEDEQIKDRLERIVLVTPFVRAAVGEERTQKAVRQGVNEFLAGKNVDGLWRLTYAYSLDKGQSNLLRLMEKMSRVSGYQITVYKANSPLTLTQQILAQALVEFRAQHYDEAVGLCQRAISLEPNNALAYKRLGSALFALHQFAGAKGAWEKAMTYEMDSVSKAQLKTFIELARRAALGLPDNLPGQNTNDEEDNGGEAD